MIRTPLSLVGKLPIDREKAALIASTASRFQSTITLERDGILLNVKSMIGLLSQSIPKDGTMELVTNGDDEAQAAEAVLAVMQSAEK